MSETGTHACMHEPGDDGEVFSEVRERLQVRRGRVIRAALAGNETLWQKTERSADADHAPRCF